MVKPGTVSTSWTPAHAQEPRGVTQAVGSAAEYAEENQPAESVGVGGRGDGIRSAGTRRQVGQHGP